VAQYKRLPWLAEEVFPALQLVRSAGREVRSLGPCVGIEWAQQGAGLAIVRDHLVANRDSRRLPLSVVYVSKT